MISLNGTLYVYLYRSKTLRIPVLLYKSWENTETVTARKSIIQRMEHLQFLNEVPILPAGSATVAPYNTNSP